MYAAFTGDGSVWDVQTSWLTGDPLTDEEQERYFTPSRTVYRSSLYIHAVRALDRALHSRCARAAADRLRGLERRL